MTKGHEAVFNAGAARFPQKQPGKKAFKGPNKGKLSGNPLGSHPTNVWQIANVGHNHPDKKWGSHPAQFPLALAKRAVLLYTLPGQSVCDSFSGSGTSAEACIQTGRHFYGADLFYEDMRAARLAAAVPDLVSILPGVTEESLAIWEAEAFAVEHPPVFIPTEEQERVMVRESEEQLTLLAA